jgi:uncharacterized Zn-finger protein
MYTFCKKENHLNDNLEVDQTLFRDSSNILEVDQTPIDTIDLTEEANIDESLPKSSIVDENNHQNNYNNNNPHKCETCLKTFCQHGNLIRHLRTHTGEKPYKCSKCPSKFLRIDNLKEHMNLHTGNKPFKCGLCSKSFTYSGSLATHIRTGSRLHGSNLA